MPACLKSTLPNGRLKLKSTHLSDQQPDLVQMQIASQKQIEAEAALLHLMEGHAGVHEVNLACWQNNDATKLHSPADGLSCRRGQRPRCSSWWSRSAPSAA